MGIAFAFLKRYWKLLALIIFIALAYYAYNAFVERIYNKGFDAGKTAQYEADKKKMDDLQFAHDQRVTKLESAAHKLADQLDAEKKSGAARVAALDKKLLEQANQLDRIRYSSDGKPMQCAAQEVIYLGPNFTQLWNEYNQEAWK